MPLFKNTSLHPVDVGGQILASGEVAELAAGNHAVRQAVHVGDLVEVGSNEDDGPAAEVAGEAAGDEAPAEADQADEAESEQEPEAQPEKPAKSTRRSHKQES